jgi:cytochrome P450
MMTVPPTAGQFVGSDNDLLDWMKNCRREFGDIYQAHVYGGRVFVISDLRYVHHVLRKNWHNYRKGLAIQRIRLLLGKGLMVSEGELWKRQRRMIQPAFHEKLLRNLEATITLANESLLGRWEQAARDARSVNITRDISLSILEIVLRAIFGPDYNQVWRHFVILSDEHSRTLQFAQAFRSLGGLITQVANCRRANGIVSNDILGALMKARDRDTGQRMSDAQLVDETLTLVVAGHETTASTLSWMWYLLSQNPHAERKLHDEVSRKCSFSQPDGFDYMRQVIEETMRLYPAGWLLTRRAIDDDTLGEYFVPAGTEIYLSPYIIQRHPELWEDPDQFDPGRFDPIRSTDRDPLTTLPFSAGPRNCIGEHLARLEMRIHLGIIATKLRLSHIETGPLELDLGVNLRSRHDFIMRPTLLAS